MTIRFFSLTMILAPTVAAMDSPTPADAVEPCCGITTIDAMAQTVTASDRRGPDGRFSSRWPTQRP